MKTRDLIPLKVVVDEQCVSRATLWRARKSGIPGFPAPLVIRRQVFWRRADLGKLEAALMLYRGRVEFERTRQAEKKVARLKAQALLSRRGKRQSRPPRRQPDLFDRGA